MATILRQIGWFYKEHKLLEILRKAYKMRYSLKLCRTKFSGFKKFNLIYKFSEVYLL